MISGTFGFLNEQGKNLYPNIFPQGRVPLVSIFLEQASLVDFGKIVEKEIYRIDISKISVEQYDAIIAIAAKNNNLSDAYVKLCFDQLQFIPIRADLIATTKTDQLSSNVADGLLVFEDEDPSTGLGDK